MTKLSPTFIGGLLLCLGVLAPVRRRRLLAWQISDEPDAFRTEALRGVPGCVYSPALWFSYNDSLYFQAQERGSGAGNWKP